MARAIAAVVAGLAIVVLTLLGARLADENQHLARQAAECKAQAQYWFDAAQSEAGNAQDKYWIALGRADENARADEPARLPR